MTRKERDKRTKKQEISPGSGGRRHTSGGGGGDGDSSAPVGKWRQVEDCGVSGGVSDVWPDALIARTFGHLDNDSAFLSRWKWPQCTCICRLFSVRNECKRPSVIA